MKRKKLCDIPYLFVLFHSASMCVLLYLRCVVQSRYCTFFLSSEESRSWWPPRRIECQMSSIVAVTQTCIRICTRLKATSPDRSCHSVERAFKHGADTTLSIDLLSTAPVSAGFSAIVDTRQRIKQMGGPPPNANCQLDGRQMVWDDRKKLAAILND